MKKLRIIFQFIVVAICTTVSAQSLELKITNIRNDKGVFRVGIFTDEEHYKSGDPRYYLTLDKKHLHNGQIIHRLDSIPPGEYGIVVLDDENSNDKTDYSFLLFPKEGFGLSNYPITKVQIPKFDDFKFNYTNNIMVEIQMKYL